MANRYTQKDRADDEALLAWMDAYAEAQMEMGHTPSAFWFSIRDNIARQIAGI